MEKLRVETAENFQQKCPVVFVLDRSGSMAGEPINEVNKGIVAFAENMSADSISKVRVELSIIAYDNNIDVVREFATVQTNVDMPTLYAGGLTHTESAMIKASELVEERKAYYKANKIPYYRPYIILLTDGQTYGENQSVTRLGELIKNAEKNKKFQFMGFGVADANMDELNSIKGETSIVAKIAGVDSLATFFTWLSSSIDALSKSGDNEEVDMTPDEDNNPFIQTAHVG